MKYLQFHKIYAVKIIGMKKVGYFTGFLFFSFLKATPQVNNFQKQCFVSLLISVEATKST